MPLLGPQVLQGPLDVDTVRRELPHELDQVHLEVLELRKQVAELEKHFVSAGKEGGAHPSQQQPWVLDAMALGREVGVGALRPPSISPAAGHPGSRCGRCPMGASPCGPSPRPPRPSLVAASWVDTVLGASPSLGPPAAPRRGRARDIREEGCPLSPRQVSRPLAERLQSSGTNAKSGFPSGGACVSVRLPAPGAAACDSEAVRAGAVGPRPGAGQACGTGPTRLRDQVRARGPR